MEHNKPSMYLSLIIIEAFTTCNLLVVPLSGITIPISKSKAKSQRLAMLPNITQMIKDRLGFQIHIE